MKILIVGAGKLGSHLAKALSMKENQVTLMDLKQSALDQAVDVLNLTTLLMNGVEVSSLRHAGVDQLHVTIAVTGDDETNLLIAFLSKRLGCQRVLARVRNPEYASQSAYISNEMTIDLIVNPEEATARAIQHYLLKEKNLHMNEFAGGKIVLAEVHANALTIPEKQTLHHFNDFGNVLVAAIARNGQVVIPDGDTFVEKTDLLYLAGKKVDVQHFVAEHGMKQRDHRMRWVVVVGGGRIGYYLTKSLTKLGIRVTCIEINPERCKYLAQKCEKALILNADGTDLNLLKSEGVFNADALVAVTGHDEENLILSLLAKQFGSEKAVTKVSRSSYIPILEKLGVDAAFNPVILTAGHVLRFILEGKVESLSLLLGGMAEAVEISIQPGASITQKSLQQLKLPKGMIIAAILKEDEVVIPVGTSQIQPGDRVVVFLHTHLMDQLETIFYPPRQGKENGLWH